MRFAEWYAAGAQTPYIVAELGVAHEGKLERAVKLIQLAALAGADAVKFQAYKADRLASSHSPTYFNQRGAIAKTQHEFFRRYDGFGESEYRACAAAAQAAKVDFLCTAFDEETASWVRSLVPAWKVASGDFTNWPLIDLLAPDGKPLILSTGATTWDEIDATIRRYKQCEIILLHCILSYPTAPSDAQLWTVPELIRRYNLVVGYSDHTHATPGMEVCALAYALGARLIEKHFTDDHRLTGNDHYHSMESGDLRRLLERIGAYRRYLGTGDRTEVFAVEALGRSAARRSWHAIKSLPAGHVLEPGDLMPKRPGTGLPPTVEPWGRTLNRALAADAVLTEAHLG